MRGLVISACVKRDYIDSRPDVQESVKILGNIAHDFNFAQKPRPPYLLPLHLPFS